MDVSNKELVAIVGSVGSGKVYNSFILYNIKNKNKKILIK
jgi:ABC-type glutathione transport system ATPase component